MTTGSTKPFATTFGSHSRSAPSNRWSGSAPVRSRRGFRCLGSIGLHKTGMRHGGRSVPRSGPGHGPDAAGVPARRKKMKMILSSLESAGHIVTHDSKSSRSSVSEDTEIDHLDIMTCQLVPSRKWELVWERFMIFGILSRDIKAIYRLTGDPYGNRTRVSAVKGPRPNR